MNDKPPFRADHVGSLLRPSELVEARAKAKTGLISASELEAVEDSSIREVAAKQEAVGLRGVTDGEFRRDYWHLDFCSQIEGITLKSAVGVGFQSVDAPPMATVSGKLRCTRPIMTDHFAYLKSVVKQTPKLCIPAPATLHFRGGRGAISREAYPDLAEFWADAAEAWRVAIDHLVAAGCTYLQLDDVSFSYLCDEKVRANLRSQGDDPVRLPRIYAEAINGALTGRSEAMTITMHTCRGNFRSSWVASGGYEDAVIEAMFSADVDGFFMEYDSARAGGFEPLRLLPKNKKVILGLVTSKVGALESKDDLKRRIDEAAKFVPLENLCLSPQCGFASTHHGNALGIDEQWRKLERVVEVAREVWGEN